MLTTLNSLATIALVATGLNINCPILDKTIDIFLDQHLLAPKANQQPVSWSAQLWFFCLLKQMRFAIFNKWVSASHCVEKPNEMTIVNAVWVSSLASVSNNS